MSMEEAPPNSVYRVRFHATGEAFALVVLKNFFLTVVTLGIYAAWAKTNRRKFLWQNTEFEGQRLVYDGTGREIALGYMKVALVYVAFGFVSKLVDLLPKPIPLVFKGLSPFLILSLVGYAVYASRAYLMRVTRYRGVQFGLERSGRSAFVKVFFGWSLLTVLSFGLCGPILGNRIYAIITNHSRFGSTLAKYEGSDGEAYGIFLRSLPWLVLSLGIYYPWYRARVMRFRAENTVFDGARMRCDVEGIDLFLLQISNFLLLVCTLGLAFPWVVVRYVRFFTERISAVGSIHFDGILQKASEGDAVGDAAADALDVDLAI